ncbi:MAG: hypothetical protein AB7K24_03900 [Gemmataceae bacterium]
MLPRAALSHILENDALTRGLTDPEARILIEWLVEQAERYGQEHPAPAELVLRLCLRARSIARFVVLWCHQGQTHAALQLAASERFVWPLPSSPAIDPCELMHDILSSETHLLAA